MLGKLLGELPPDASEMPTTLMRLGELEWEEAREALERVQNDKELSVRNAAVRALREWQA